MQRLNPEREVLIRRVTGWESLAPGSLNLAVDDSIIEQLRRLRRVFEEPASQTFYPAPYQYIPEIRKGYWYYRAVVRRAGIEEAVLVRRAIVPVPGVVELFSRESLTAKLHLKQDDVLAVEALAPQLPGAP